MGIVRGDNSLFFATALDNSGLKQGSNDAVNIIQGLSSSIGRINPFAALVTFALTAFATISAQAYQMSKNFEHAMKEVETISSATQKNFDGISEKVFDLSKISPDSPEKLANAYYQIVSAGYDGAEGLQLLETSAKAAVAGVTDTITAADGITTVLNAFKKDASESNDVADALFNTVKLGKTTFSELSANISQVAPIAAASNIPLNEILATVASLTKQGVPTAQAMTQIRSAIVGLNESGRLDGTKTFQENMQSVYDTFNGNQTAIQKEVGRIEAVQAILAVSGRNAQEAKNDLLQYNNTIGATEEAFKRMTSSNVNQWSILRNRIKATTKGIGDSILEMSSGIARIMNRVFEETKTVREEVAKQASEYQILKNTVLDTNTEFNKKLEILRKLKADYPQYLSSLDLDKIKNENLDDVLQKVKGSLEEINKLHERRLELSGFEDSANSAKKQQETYRDLYESNFREFQIAAKKASDYAKENGIELNYSLSDSPQKIYDEIRRAFITEDNDGLLSTLFGERNSIVNGLFHIKESVSVFKRELGKATDQFEKENEELRKQRILLKDNEEGYKDVANEISKVNSLQELEVYDQDYSFPKIKKAIKERASILKTIDEINSISKADFKKGELSQYLKSENDEIRIAAEKRKSLFTTKITGNGGKTDDKPEIERFEDLLNERKKQYESYQNYVNQLGKEAADKEYETLLKQGANYTEYLRNQLNKFQDNQVKKKAIVDAASSSDVRLTPREKVEPISTIKRSELVLDIKIDSEDYTKSIAQLEKELSDLEEKRYKSNSKREQKSLDEKIKNKRKEVDAAKNSTSKQEDLYSNLTRTIEGLNNRELRNRIKMLKERLKNEKLTAEQIIEIEGQIQESREQIGNQIQQTAGEIAGVFRQVGSLFQKFGDEDTAQLLDQIAGVAEGIGQLGKGIATGNPLDIISGGLQILDSALTVEIVSDTAKFEEAIKELEKVIDKLDYVISKSVGNDKITGRKQAIEDLQELEKQADLAYEAEKKARKEVKLLGIKLWSKGSGSGTDPAKLEELEQKAEDARRKAEELREKLDELYTGTTQATIVDSIISGLKEGKRTVEDFADNFKDLMQDAMLQAFQIKYLEKEIEKFYDAFAEAGSDSNYTAEEIDALRNLYNAMIQGAQDDLDAINQILEDSGIGSLGSEDSQQTGLAGAISNITENTANILAGTLNSIRIDVQNGLEAAQQSLTYLSQIAQNTSYNSHLEVIELRLTSIETLLS